MASSSSSSHSSSSSSIPEIREISKCFVKPQSIPEESKEPCYLAHWDLSVLNGKYIQTGILFQKPQHPSSSSSSNEHQNPVMTTIVDTLKSSLSRVLVDFYPLAGRLVTHKDDSPSYYIYIDCSNPQGAEFIHAVSDLTIDHILSPTDVPEIIRSLFLYTGAINHDGHILPLLGVQITELVDGYFIGCSLNHVVGDGTAFWHFFNSWAEIGRSKSKVTIHSISHLPVLKRWFLQGYGPILNLPYSAPEEFIDRYTPKPFRERIFHFTNASMSALEFKANNQDYCNYNINTSSKNINSYQALCALLWRCVTRIRGVASDEIGRFFLTMGDRYLVDPPLTQYYLGNCVSSAMGAAAVGELLTRDLGYAASVIHEAVENHTKELVRKKIEDWMKSPVIRQMAHIMDGRYLVIGLSRFDLYGNDFGWGKPVTIRRAAGIKFDGRISAYQGREGGTSLDVVCCLGAETMSALEIDEEFMSFVNLV